MTRRPLLLATLGWPLAGLAAPSAPPASAPEAAPDGWWDSRFARPDGGELRLANYRGRWLLVNFWATWCAPCLKELPDLSGFAQAQTARGAEGWQVIGLAVDAPTPVRQFLAHQSPPLAFPSGLAGLNGAQWTRKFGNTTGALPFTLAFDPQGRVRWRRRGQTHRAELDALVLSLG